MGSECSCDTEELLSDDECEFRDDMNQQQHGKRVAIRDYPPGCGPAKRSSSQVFTNSTLIQKLGTMDHSEQKLDAKKMLELARKTELVQAYDPEVLDNEGLKKSETATLLKKDVQMKAKASYPPRRTISAFRSFPLGCGPKGQLVHGEVDSSTCLTANILSHRIRSLLTTLSEEDEEPKEFSSASESIMRESDIDCSEMFKTKQQEKQKNVMVKILDGRPGEYCERTQLQETIPTGFKYPADRPIVLGLMAASKCPWRQGKRRFTIQRNSPSDRAKMRIQKH